MIRTWRKLRKESRPTGKTKKKKVRNVQPTESLASLGHPLTALEAPWNITQDYYGIEGFKGGLNQAPGEAVVSKFSQSKFFFPQVVHADPRSNYSLRFCSLFCDFGHFFFIHFAASGKCGPPLTPRYHITVIFECVQETLTGQNCGVERSHTPGKLQKKRK